MSNSTSSPEAVRAMNAASEVHEPYATLADIDDAAIERYHRDGFLAIAQLFTPDEVEQYRGAITNAVARDARGEFDEKIIHYEPTVSEEAVARMDLYERELAVRKLFKFWDELPELAAAGKHAGMVGLCEKLLGEPMKMFQDMALLKPPHGGVEKPWHQDTAYFPVSDPTKVIGTWTALDEADQDNGCMFVVPGTHHAGPKPHYHDRDCQLPDDEIDREHVVAVPLPPGGGMIFSGLLHHGTPPNASGKRRRALQFHFLGASAHITHDEAELTALFHDDKGFAGCQGWWFGQENRPIAERVD